MEGEGHDQMGVESFGGKIGKTYKDSTPEWSGSTEPVDAPNVLVILLDDTGFGNLGCYGSTIATPNMDALAAKGLRYNNFHVTPLCSPSRACLLTGRNHHAVGMATIAGGGDAGFPNQRGRISRYAATLPEMLREEGFATFALGKWHLNPVDHNSAAGPCHEWPLQRGFDRFYGFLPGATDQFFPELTYDNHPVPPPKTPAEGYHLTEDLVDHAIEFVNDLKAIRSKSPFFTYFASGAMHNPHQAPQSFIDRYRGRFDEGWDVIRERYFERQKALGIIPAHTRLPPRNPGVQPWDTLSPNEQKFVCRLQEAWAGFLEHTDVQIGRLIDHLRSIGELDNTLVILTADNGTSQNGGPYGVMNVGPNPRRNAANDGRTVGERLGNPVPEEDFEAIQEKLDDIGGPHSYTDIPWGWAQVGNTPLRWYKQDTHAGGVRVPMIIHYPQGITDAGGIRNQFHYVTDVAPTILEILHLEPRPSYGGYEQMPITGTSLAYTLSDGSSPTRKPVQHFEMTGNRALWCDGWMAVVRHEPGNDYDTEAWELYHLDEDFSESNDLAAREPERLKEMVARWWVEAERHGVLPLDDRMGNRGPETAAIPAASNAPDYRFVPPMGRLASKQSPAINARDWSLIADLEVPRSGSDGVIYAQGKSLDGLSLFVQDGVLALACNVLGTETIGRCAVPLPTGRITAGVTFTRGPDDAGTFTFMVNGSAVDTLDVADVTRIPKMRGVEIGRNRHSPIATSYQAPFEFVGTIYSVEIYLGTR
jgi:arylsulfatase